MLVAEIYFIDFSAQRISKPFLLELWIIKWTQYHRILYIIYYIRVLARLPYVIYRFNFYTRTKTTNTGIIVEKSLDNAQMLMRGNIVSLYILVYSCSFNTK